MHFHSCNGKIDRLCYYTTNRFRMNTLEGEHIDCVLDSNQTSNLDHTLLAEDVLRSCQEHHPLRTCSGGTSVPAAAPIPLPSSLPFQHLQQVSTTSLTLPSKTLIVSICSFLWRRTKSAPLSWYINLCQNWALMRQLVPNCFWTHQLMFLVHHNWHWDSLLSYSFSYNNRLQILLSATCLFYYFYFSVSKVSTVYQNSKLRMSLTLTYQSDDFHSVKWFNTVRSHEW